MPKCSWCKCLDHDEYWECPLFDGKPICDICCYYDVESYNPETDRLKIIDVIKKVTGKDYDEQTVIKTCRECGKGGLKDYDF